MRDSCKIKNLKSCCNGIKALTGDCCKKTGEPLLPIEYINEKYYFSDREIDFCPSCGTSFKTLSLEKSSPTAINPQIDAMMGSDFCCNNIKENINSFDSGDWFAIFYQSWIKRYFFSNVPNFNDNKRLEKPYEEWDFYYCLYCGKKLPESLFESWLEIVKKDFGVDKQEPIEKMLPKLPEEFKTDLWWKKRGL